ncbi:MAG: uroporphyrinogen-III C-methyltransferase [Chthonomonadales bacterium]
MSDGGAGTVYLVGAGPGDPGLLTVRGAEVLKRADVVIYDRLVHPQLLRHAPHDAELVYVGKEASRHTLRQEEINALIVQKAQEGKIVCRLKGGDPFVFGRGGEEAEACVAASIPFEVVPGVTSAVAAPAYAGIPVTHREAASSFLVATGHEDPSKTESRLRWEHLAHAADTLIFLMGVENLATIAGRLLAAGKDAHTPVALIRWGTWRRQEVLESTLGQVEADVRKTGFGPPAVTIVGPVVGLRAALRWFDTKPLFGKRIVVTRAREQASSLSALLEEQGAEALEFPLIRVVPLPDFSDLDAALRRLPGHAHGDAGYQWVVFTSANGVSAVRTRLEQMGADARAFGGTKLAAIGPGTAAALAAWGLRADFVPSQFVAEAVADEWPEHDMAGKRVLLPRARGARDVLVERLAAMGAAVDAVPAYDTVMDGAGAQELIQELQQGEIHAITFTSSSTVRNFVAAVGPQKAQEAARGVVIASIGPITSATVRELGMEPTVEAGEHTIPGLVQALVGYFEAHPRGVPGE